MESLVWYACYGSNLSRKRFLCYITGDIPEGSTQKEEGCRDKTLPVKDKPININYPLYFSKESKKWNGGVAFIGHEKITSDVTLGRMYLVTKEQFIDVVKQENKIKSISIDFDSIIKHGADDVCSGWYGRIIYLGDSDKFPIFTFTGIDEIEHTIPSEEYLKWIIRGLKEMRERSDDEIFEYLWKKPGIQKGIKKDELIDRINRT